MYTRGPMDYRDYPAGQADRGLTIFGGVTGKEEGIPQFEARLEIPIIVIG